MDSELVSSPQFTNELALKIAGEITLSQNPGASLKKWREIFSIQQTELAEYLKVTPSTISDYEGNRRASPGIQVIKRFVNALVELDKQKGSWIMKKMDTNNAGKKDIYTVGEFSEPLSAKEFCKRIEARVLTNDSRVANIKLNGCTVVDAMRAILELPSEEFMKLYGSSTERAAVFTNVSLGRGPMIAIRVLGLKPALVVFQNIADVDKLALKISEIERIPIAVTALPIEEIKRRVIS
ncbi:helix-turn-helix domain-containing protein [Candidatus Micrarchaeota archaeon]|nr:helix-turn-helix domain-containing protein [Candidatus Micrarchaeota archaeon]